MAAWRSSRTLPEKSIRWTPGRAAQVVGADYLYDFAILVVIGNRTQPGERIEDPHFGGDLGAQHIVLCRGQIQRVAPAFLNKQKICVATGAQVV